MKKSFSIVAAFCLGLFVSIAVVSCAIDGDENVQSKPNSSELSSSPVIDNIRINGDYSTFNYEFGYNNEGRISKISLNFVSGDDSTNVTYSVNYSGKKATIKCSYFTTTVTFEESLDSYSAEKINSQILQAFSLSWDL